ncbi:hypothetical protein ACF0H5_014940 [Mactra antiquata]
MHNVTACCLYILKKKRIYINMLKRGNLLLVLMIGVSHAGMKVSILKFGTKRDVKKQILFDDYRFHNSSYHASPVDVICLSSFRHENQSFPDAISNNGKLHAGQKSQLANILEANVFIPDSKPQYDVIVVDGSSLVRSVSPKKLKTFEEYAVKVLFQRCKHTSLNIYRRTYIVLDVYNESSLKAETWLRRGKCERRRVTHETRLPQNWKR